jgi:phage gp29-like protein
LRLLVEEPEDLAALADQMAKLVPLGLPIPQRWVREQWGIPEPAPGEPVLGAPAQPGPAGPMTGGVAQAANRHMSSAHAQGAEPDPTPIDAQTDRLHREAMPAWVEIMDAIKRLVDEAQSLDELRDALLAAYGDLPTARLAEIMAMAFAAAELAGRFDVRQESQQ